MAGQAVDSQHDRCEGTTSTNLASGQGLPELGLVCITASQQVRYRTITRTRLLQLEPAAQEQRLRQLYGENLQRLERAIAFCLTHGLRLYRLTSGLFPFADLPVGQEILLALAPDLKRIGDRATAAGLRLVLHLEPFVVLSSDQPEVIRNSIQVLALQALILDLLGQPRSPWATMELHGGKRDRQQRLQQVMLDLPEAIRSRLALENDEYAYGVTDLLPICEATGAPLVFDAHHHVIQAELDSYDAPEVAQMLKLAGQTWPRPDWQLVHISNGRDGFRDPHHSDLIALMPACYRHAPWIEVEAKLKEQAIAQLQTEWLPKLGHAVP